MPFTGLYNIDSSSTSGSTNSKVLFHELKAIATSPRISTVLSIENTTPASLFAHPRKAKSRIFSSSLPIRPNAMNTPTRITANDTIFSICSEAEMYCDIHLVAMSAKRADAHMPTTKEIIEIACDINPLRNPWNIAGMRHIKIMASSIFIYFPKMCIFAD